MASRKHPTATRTRRSSAASPRPSSRQQAAPPHAWLRLALDIATDALCVYQVDSKGQPGRFLDANDTACRMLGYPRDQLLNLGPTDVVAPEASSPLDHVSDVVRRGHGTIESRYVTRTGAHLPVEIGFHCFAHGRQTLVVERARDIRERRRHALERMAAAELARVAHASADLSALADNILSLMTRWSGCAGVGIHLTPSAGGSLVQTAGLAPAPGPTAEDLTGFTSSPHGSRDSSPADPDPGFSPSVRVTAKGSVWIGPLSRLPHHAGLPPRLEEWCHACDHAGCGSVAVVPLRANGSVLGVMHFLHVKPDGLDPDLMCLLEHLASQASMAITQRVNADALRVSQERHHGLFANNHAVMLLLDAGTGHVEDANPAACRFYGYSQAQLVGMDFAQLTMVPVAELQEELSSALTGQRRYFRFKQRLANQEIRDVEVHAGPIPGGGRTLLCCIVHDITQRRQAEEALQRTQENLELKVRDRTAELSHALTQLRAEFWERERVERQLRQNVQMQSAINAVLRLSLSDQPLDRMLRQAIELLFSVGLLDREQQACLLLTGSAPDHLVPMVQRGGESCPSTRCAPAAVVACCRRALERGGVLYVNTDDINCGGHLKEGGCYVAPISFAGSLMGAVTVHQSNGVESTSVKDLLTTFADTLAGILVRRRTQNALEQAEDEKRRVVHTINGIVWERAVDGRVLFISEHAERLLGHPRARWLEEPGLWMECLHPEDRATAVQALQEALATGKDYETEYRMRAADGHSIWFRDVVSVTAAEDGTARLRGVMIDVTTRREVEQALARTNNLLEAMVAAQSRFIVDRDPRAFFAHALDSMLTLTGSHYGFIGEVLYRNGSPYLKTHAMTNIAWNQETRELYEHHEKQGLEFTNLHTLFGAVMTSGQPVLANQPAQDPRRGGKVPAGHPPLQSFLGLPVYTGHRMVGMVGMANRPGGYDDAVVRYLDPLLTTCGNVIEAYQLVRRRQEAEEALRNSEERFRQMAENMSEVFWMLDARNRRVLYVSPAFRGIWGIQEERLYAHPELWVDAVHAEDRPRMLGQMEAWQSEAGEVEYRIHRPDGSLRWIRHTSFPVRNDQGVIYRVVGVAEDITERKRHAEALLEARRHATVGRLAAAVAHEVNNPLGAIKAQLSLLREDLSDVHPSATAHLVVVGEQVDRIARTVQALLGFARQRRVRGHPVPLGDILDSVIRLFAATLRAKGIGLDVALPPSLPIIQGDVDQLQEVFVNILENARELLPPGACVTVNGEVHPSEVEIRIENDGPPFPDDPERVFEPFFTTRPEGVGLGLYIARRICVAHGGMIVAENRSVSEGSGVRFRIRLPRDAGGTFTRETGLTEPVKA